MITLEQQLIITRNVGDVVRTYDGNYNIILEVQQFVYVLKVIGKCLWEGKYIWNDVRKGYNVSKTDIKLVSSKEASLAKYFEALRPGKWTRRDIELAQLE